MKAKKWVTFITMGISIVSLTCAIIANFKLECNIIYDISMAIFGSALLGCIMSLIEYFAERKKAMEDFLSAAYRAFVQLKRIKYIDVNEPQELIFNCINEEQDNDLIKEIEEETAKVMGLTFSHEKRSAYIDWMKENEIFSFSENDDIESILISIYNQRIENYKKTFLSRIDMYIKLSKLDLENLSSAYGNLDFLFGNSSIRTAAYNFIFTPLNTYRDKILCESYHFNLLKEGEGNFAVCVDILFKLNNFFFEITKERNENCEQIVVYQRLFDDVYDRINDFKAATYFKKKTEYKKKSPVFCKTRSLSIN